VFFKFLVYIYNNIFKNILHYIFLKLKALIYFIGYLIYNIIRDFIAFLDWVLGCIQSGLIFIFLYIIFVIYYNYIWINYLVTTYPFDFIFIQIIWLFYP